MEKGRRKLIEKNAEAVARFLEFADFRVMKGTAPSYFNLEADKDKPGWTPPMSERGHRSASDPDNIHFTKHVGYILRNLEETKLYLPAKLLWHDPTILRRWRAKETQNDEEWLRRFNRLCRFVAIQLDRRYPGVRVRWSVRPEDEETLSKIHARNQDNNRAKIRTAHDTYRKIDTDIKTIISEESCTVEAAIGLYRDRLQRNKKPDVSPRTIKIARAFVKEEEQESA